MEALKSKVRKVADSNFLQSDALRKYLSKSPQNFVVLTDYAAMEAYKGDTLASIYRSMEILVRHPRQVIVLKGTQTLCGLRGRRAGLQRRLIDSIQTREFTKFCQFLVAAEHGNVGIQHQLLEHGRVATSHIGRLLSDAASIPGAFDAIARTYTDAEIGILQRGSQITRPMADKLIRNTLLIAGFLFKDHPRVVKIPTATDLPNTFIFRVALCAHLLVLHWISTGGAMKTNPKKLRNDLVDINFAATATYFDGLLTADKRLDRIYRDANFFLDEVFLAGE